MLADMVIGKTGPAEVLFLIAAIAAGIEVILGLLSAKGINFLAVAVCLIAVAFVLL
jgi:hypothetical protein